MTIHIVYPYDKTKIAAPWSIGNHLALAFGPDVIQYDWTEKGTIIPKSGDILLGHPHPKKGYIFNNSLGQPFTKRYAITPWNTTQYDMLAPIVPLLDHVFLICGEYWFSMVIDKIKSKATRLDMAIDKEHYKPIKTVFNNPGYRNFLYIGHGMECKGAGLIPNYVKNNPSLYIGHMGYDIIPGTYKHGFLDFTDKRNLQLVASYDFLLAPGIQDANATTVGEAMAWGLIPICTQQTGWPSPPAIHIPSDDIMGALDILEYWQNASTLDLLSMQNVNLKMLNNYTWDIFTNKVKNVING